MGFSLRFAAADQLVPPLAFFLFFEPMLPMAKQITRMMRMVHSVAPPRPSPEDSEL